MSQFLSAVFKPSHCCNKTVVKCAPVATEDEDEKLTIIFRALQCLQQAIQHGNQDRTEYLPIKQRSTRVKSAVPYETCACGKFMIYVLFLGWEVRIGKNCARGFEYGPSAAWGRT